MDNTHDTIYENLIAYIRKAVGVPALKCVVANQNASELSGEYCTLLMFSTNSVGLGMARETFVPEVPAVEDDPDTEEDESVPAVEEYIVRQFSQLIDMRVSVQFFRGYAHEYARKLMAFSVTESAQEILYGKNIVVKPIQNYRSLDYNAGGQWTPRTQLDLYLQSSSEYADTVGVIRSGTLEINEDEVGESGELEITI